MKKFTAIDLFAGIGGVKLGLTKAGFDVIFSNDCDKFCEITFRHNFPNAVLDTRKIEEVILNMDDIPSHDLLAAGFPCQPFSLAGLKKGFEDPRGSLFHKVVDILDNKKPQAFLLENVKNLKNHAKGETLKIMLGILRDKLNYFVPEPQILNSKNFGVPQNRERIYIVGFKDKKAFENFKYPEGSDLVPRIRDVLEESVDDWYYLSQKYYEGLVKHAERHKAKKQGFGLKILDKDGISNTLVVGNMGRERNLIKDAVRNNFYKEGMDRALTKNNEGVRKLTIRECARLQGFPESFSFEKVSKTQAYKQLGNTVSVPAIKAVAFQLFNLLTQSYEATYTPQNNFDSYI